MVVFTATDTTIITNTTMTTDFTGNFDPMDDMMNQMPDTHPVLERHDAVVYEDAQASFPQPPTGLGYTPNAHGEYSMYANIQPEHEVEHDEHEEDEPDDERMYEMYEEEYNEMYGQYEEDEGDPFYYENKLALREQFENEWSDDY